MVQQKGSDNIQLQVLVTPDYFLSSYNKLSVELQQFLWFGASKSDIEQAVEPSVTVNTSSFHSRPVRYSCVHKKMTTTQ